ncbi:unnamed protein product, partial [marine sediment metagenome]
QAQGMAKLIRGIENVAVMGILFSFLARYQELAYKLVFQSMLIRNKEQPDPKDVWFAMSILENCLFSLAYFLEHNSWRQQFKSDKFNKKELKELYLVIDAHSGTAQAGKLIVAMCSTWRKSKPTTIAKLKDFCEIGVLERVQEKGAKEVYYKIPEHMRVAFNNDKQ